MSNVQNRARALDTIPDVKVKVRTFKTPGRWSKGTFGKSVDGDGFITWDETGTFHFKGQFKSSGREVPLTDPDIRNLAERLRGMGWLPWGTAYDIETVEAEPEGQ